MPTLDDLPTPALLLDLEVLERNLERMARRTTALGVALRPHIKTHKCLEIARRQRDLGARGLTVSTLEEARVFADAGFDDLTWAFPVALSRLDEVGDLARRTGLRLLVDSQEATAAVEELARALATRLHVWLEVDCGDHRSGVDPARQEAGRLARRLAESEHLAFDGLLTHSGQAYRARGREELAEVAATERRVMVAFAEELRRAGIAVPGVSVGSTPALSAAANLEGVTEARPGNYAFYDFTQATLGSCSVADCAVTVLASVVSSPPGAAHSVVDAGALALSKDLGPADGGGGFGRIYGDYATAALHPEVHLTGLSQEHGVLSHRRPVGSRLRILPNHSCLTVACFDEYHVMRGDRLVDRWKIWRRR